MPDITHRDGLTQLCRPASYTIPEFQDHLADGGTIQTTGCPQYQLVTMFIVEVDGACLDTNDLGDCLNDGLERGVEIEGRVGGRDDLVQAVQFSGASHQP